MDREYIISKLNAIGPYGGLNMRLEDCSEVGVALGISIEGNRNDKNTMFAGSIYSAMVLAGWVLARAASYSVCPFHDVVIKESGTRYRLPVKGDCTARAEVAEPVKETRAGVYALTVKVKLHDNAEGRVCAEFTGTYVCVPAAGAR